MPRYTLRLADDVVCFAFDIAPEDFDQHWVVLEEPPAELRFRNDIENNPDISEERTQALEDSIREQNNGAHYATAIIDRATRVAISGDYLTWLETHT